VNHFLAICDGKIPPVNGMTVMRDVTIAKEKTMGEMSITKIQNFNKDEILFMYPKSPQIINLISDILGPNIKSMHTMLINKPPDTGKGSSKHPPHQDLWYFTFRPVNKIIAVWTALQKINHSNGCLTVRPGSHKLPLYKHGYPTDGSLVNYAYHGIYENGVGMSTVYYALYYLPLYNYFNLTAYIYCINCHVGDGMIDVPMEKGDTLLFHPLLVHGSGPNLSTVTRKVSYILLLLLLLLLHISTYYLVYNGNQLYYLCVGNIMSFRFI
jgi:phytanoyl-CoA hydroxylase